jgi:hypothetical protein
MKRDQIVWIDLGDAADILPDMNALRFQQILQKNPLAVCLPICHFGKSKIGTLGFEDAIPKATGGSGWCPGYGFLSDVFLGRT